MLVTERPLLTSLARQAALACRTSLAWLAVQLRGAEPLCLWHGDSASAETAALVPETEGPWHLADARHDERLARDPRVSGPAGLRCVAAMPLRLPGGECIGTIGVADTAVRRLSENELLQLEGLAGLAGQMILLLRESGRRPDRAPAIVPDPAALPDHAPGEAFMRCAQSLRDEVEAARNGPQEAQVSLRRQTDILRMVTEAIPATVVVVGSDNCYHFVNSAFERYAGLPREQIIGRTAMEVLGELEVARRRPWMRRAIAGETVSFVLDYPGPDGLQYLQMTCIPLKLDGGQVDGFVGISQDVTAQRREQARLTDQARQDPLTGLLNRLGFEQQAERHAAQGDGARLGVLYIDLDHFKPVNDTHGHAVGDQVLAGFAQRLRTVVRSSDAVARLGGDEFAVLLVNLNEAANAASVAAKIVEAAAQPFETELGPVTIGASVGSAFGVNPALGWRELVGRADAQLYQAKAGGRGTSR